MTTTKPLNARTLERLKPADATYFVSDGTVAGLQIAVHPTGRMIWSLRYRVGKHQKRMTIGRYPALQLAAARKRANTELRKVDGGVDPADQKRADRTAMTFGELVTDYIKIAKGRKSSWQEDERYLTEAADAGWRHRRVKDIKRRDVIDLVEAKASSAAVAANRLQSALSVCFGRAVDLEIIEANPCWKLKKQREQSRERTLTPDEIVKLWQHCTDNPTPITRLLRMILVTAQRSTETATMRWTDLELPDKWQDADSQAPGAWWTIPKTKRGVPHRVWLTTLALDVLREARKATPDSQWVFASTALPTTHVGDRSKKIMSALSTELFATSATRHDLRRTASTQMRAAGVSRTDLAFVLNHALREGGAVTGTYDLYEGAAEKQAALECWTRTLGGILKAKPADVVPFARPDADPKNADWPKAGAPDIDIHVKQITPKVAQR
jgi:integrase